jgi:hypothetical protein
MEHLHHSLLILLMIFASGYFVLDRVLVASSVRFGVYYAAFCVIATSMVMMILR